MALDKNTIIQKLIWKADEQRCPGSAVRRYWTVPPVAAIRITPGWTRTTIPIVGVSANRFRAALWLIKD